MTYTLLPGQRLVNGVSNYIFGTNLGQNVSTNTVYNTPAIQQQIKNGGFTVMRCGVKDNAADSKIDAMVQAVQACGCVPLMNLSLTNLSYNQHVLAYIQTNYPTFNCLMYEIGNEPNGAAAGYLTGHQYYTNAWSAQVPTLRGNAPPGSFFIGPVITHAALPGSSTFVADWLSDCVANGTQAMLPDAISWHHYPCTGKSQATCSTLNTVFSSDFTAMDNQVNTSLGKHLPLCLTEWNIGGGKPPPSYTQDYTYASNWIHKAIDNMVSAGFALAMQFEAGTGEGAGGLDLIEVTSPFPPGPDYQPIVDKIKQYIGTNVTPISRSVNSLTFSGTVGGSNPASQTLSIYNNTNSSLTYTATSSASWLTVSPSGAILTSFAVSTSTVSVSLSGLTSGTYVGTITYTSGFYSVTVTVTLNVTASGGGGGGTGSGLAPTPPYTVTIGGSPYFIEAGTLAVDGAIGRRSTAYATVHTTNTNTHFQQDQQVQITGANGVLAFSGYISIPDEWKPGFQTTLNHQLQFVDQHRLADKLIMAKAYTNKPASFIVQDIVNTYLSAEGVTVGQIYDGPLPSTTLYPATTLYPNGSDSYIPSAVFAYAQISQVLDELVKNTTSGGVPYYWQIDQNKALWFVPYTAITNSTIVDGTTIDDGTKSGMAPKVRRANPAYRNGQYIVGGVQTTVQQVKAIFGDGQTSSWPLDFDINSIQSITVNGTPKTFGIKGVDSGKDFYYAVGDPILVQDANATKLVGGPTASTNSIIPDTLKIYYIGQYPSVFYSRNAAQVSYEAGLDGTSGLVESADSDSTIVSGSTGLARVANQLQRYGVQGTQFKFNTLVPNYQQGQMITVNYAPHGFVNTQMLIEQVTASDQYDGLNMWYTIYAIAGPYDTTWVNFFSNLIQQSKNATANINVGLTSGIVQLANFISYIAVSGTMTVSVFQATYPSTTLFPDVTLYPV